MTSALELLHIPYSPWSEKARWALDARGVPYTGRHYQPLIGEPALRLRLKRIGGTVSVPVLFTAEGALSDSLDIAHYAASHGTGPNLFPAGGDIARWNALSERALAAGRTLSLQRVLKDPAALRELVPKPLAQSLGPVATQIAAFGVRRTLRKYRAPTAEAARAELRQILSELRTALGDGHHLVGDGLSYADIAMAQALAFVTPPPRGIKIGRANRRAFTDEALASEFADLLAWRDGLYDAHR